MADELQEGKWYRLTVPVQNTRTYTGRLTRKIETRDGDFVYLFQGRSAFSVVGSEMLDSEEVPAPKTGVPREAK